MPVNSSNSSVLVWPKPAEVVDAVSRWAETAAVAVPGLVRIGYFGSYARGDAGVGSDVDLVIIARNLEAKERAQRTDRSRLPVPADLVVFTTEEWEQFMATESRFAKTLARETRWVWPPSA
jgi:predicted nucleotidyltransferase